MICDLLLQAQKYKKKTIYANKSIEISENEAHFVYIRHFRTAFLERM